MKLQSIAKRMEEYGAGNFGFLKSYRFKLKADETGFAANAEGGTYIDRDKDFVFDKNHRFFQRFA